MAYSVVSQNNTVTKLEDDQGNVIHVPAIASLAKSSDYTIIGVKNSTATLEDGNGKVHRDIPCVVLLADDSSNYTKISQNNTKATLENTDGNVINIPSKVILATATDYTLIKVNNSTATLEDASGNIIRNVPCVSMLSDESNTISTLNNSTASLLDGNGKTINDVPCIVVLLKANGGAVVVIIKGTSPLNLPDAIANSLSYVKAFGGTEQRNIPQPYTQVNYVTNTAQTAVNTGIMIDFAKNYEFEVECRAVSGSWYILQSRASASGNVTGIHGETSGSTIKLVVGNVTVCTSAITRTVGNKLYVKATLNAGTATLYVKDETANTEDTQTGSYGTSQPNPTAAVYLLGNAGGQYVDVNSDIYMARIKENDTVVMDYVPARQVATAGFYDKVSGTFKTALTPANLSADGNTVPTPDAPMDIVSNNGVLKARHQSGLPLGYTLLDSVVFDSTQMIDTGFTPDNNSRIESKCYRTGEDCWFYGAGPTNPRITLYHSSTGTSRWGNQSRSNFGFLANTEYTLIEDKNGLNINGVDNPWNSGSAGDFTCDRSLTIGNNNGSTGTRYFAGNFYYMKIYDNDVLVRDFVPCQNASNVVGLYDRVNGVFYTDTGLVAGNPVSDPVEIYTDGTVETIKDSLNNTATAEMLLKVGDYQDVQSIIDGVVTRNVVVRVLDGTENWNIISTAYADGTHRIYTNDFGYNQDTNAISTHFVEAPLADRDLPTGQQGKMYHSIQSFHLRATQFTSLLAAKQWLADQYAAGTPVIVVYPLETPTTESVAGQTLQVTDGDNTLEITQASLNNLELEAEYQAAVSLTIQEVQDANLDPNVEVTIN